jgi:SSS family solute:Na+ symporter
MELNTLDTLIFVGYIVILLVIGFVSGRKKNNEVAKDFFLTSKTLPWYAVGFSIIAAGISSEHFLGAVGYSYQYGISVANWEWLNGPAIILLVIVFIPFYIRKRVITMPHFLEMRFEPRTRTLFAIISILIYVFINLAGVLYSGAFAIKVIFELDNIYVGIWILTIVAGLISIYGGMESVAWTNMFQSILLIGGGILVFVLGVIEVPGGIEEIIGTGERAHLILPADHPEIPWPALIVLMLSTNIWFFCTNQSINQAALGARNEWHAKMGVLFAGFLAILIPLADVFPGLITRALHLDFVSNNADESYLLVVNHLIPSGMKGIVFAGLTGAIISTIEAITNACSTIFTFDIYQQIIDKKADDKKLIRTGRLVGGSLLIFGALWAPVVEQFDQIFEYFQKCWAFVAVPSMIVFVLGVSWKRFSNQAAFWILCLTFPMFVLPFILTLLNVSMNGYIVAGILGIFIFAAAILISKISPASINPNSSDYVWSKKMGKLPKNLFAENLPFYKRIWFWIFILILTYIVIYTLLW